MISMVVAMYLAAGPTLYQNLSGEVVRIEQGEYYILARPWSTDVDHNTQCALLSYLSYDSDLIYASPNACYFTDDAIMIAIFGCDNKTGCTMTPSMYTVVYVGMPRLFEWGPSPSCVEH